LSDEAKICDKICDKICVVCSIGTGGSHGSEGHCIAFEDGAGRVLLVRMILGVAPRGKAGARGWRGEGGEREILPHGGSRASPGGTDNERIKTGRFADARH
jgi:hypothetical protein